MAVSHENLSGAERRPIGPNGSNGSNGSNVHDVAGL